MERNEDSELRDLLKDWEAPAVPESLERLFGARKRWWQASLRIPVPLAVFLALLLVAGLWRWPQRRLPITAERLVLRTERVEVPVVRERVVTKIIYRNRPPRMREHTFTFTELRPVNELKVRIVRHQNAAQN